ncbi:hypothetical protein [Steroidobacter sp.]|uniref:hypothetical protein n=1 Tax=Steroidobacter sp. TaxID=1978227 RepID=UPI001A5F6EE3|nr:hypothetical protein [Steroidobacter sp.]MBL8266841.1 hypothetical protein [Steroidobacter sp.]
MNIFVTGIVLGCAALVAGCATEALKELEQIKGTTLSDAAKCGLEEAVLKPGKCDKVSIECAELHFYRAQSCQVAAAAPGANRAEVLERTFDEFGAATRTLPAAVDPKFMDEFKKIQLNAPVRQAEVAIAQRTNAPDASKPIFNGAIRAAADQLSSVAAAQPAAKSYERFYRAEVLTNEALLLANRSQRCAPLQQASALLTPKIVEPAIKVRVEQLAVDIRDLNSALGCP